ncbi:MAG: DNA gyrase subunit A, partial [Halothiobacillus sp.]|nr:DNA gyrase subunit A [Halothiobacillus sp.]
MSEFAQEIFKVNLEDEMRRSYLDYAMSVIVGRALPDARDGLKPVHRRVLYAMRELGNDWNKPYKKSARVVGDVIGKYHPHGDTAVYDALVRMAQNFSMRYMLIDGQGNFGSVDGDAPAAMRYTEVRMAKIAHELQADLEKETVDFIDNYDGSESEPGVFPARYPNLLVNGSSGIAVGMATNIPPHNLTEILNATIALIDDPDTDDETLLAHVPGPDFPTAGIINGAAGIREAYLTGRGRVVMRARTHFEEDDRAGKAIIIVTELPYQVNKARLIERIAELVREKKIEGITELRDESDKDGMRIVMELRRGELPDVMLNNLYQQTQMQSVFGINMVAIVDGQPRTLGLRDILTVFLRHRREVVTRRTIFDLRKARERAHILEGLAVALANIDAMIALIKAAPTSNEARASLMAQSWDSGLVRVLLERADAAASRPESLAAEFGLQPDQSYRLSLEQAQAILEMRLNRLTGLEQEKIIEEYRGLLEKIIDLLDILRSETRLMQVIRDELVAIMDEYGDERRTEIIFDYEDLSIEDLIAEEDRVVTLSREGYIKTQSLTEYQSQRRGGRGKSSTRMKDEDVIEQMLVASTHAWVLMFTNLGRVYWRKVYQLPQGARGARGRPIVNILPLQEGERVNALLPVREFVDDHYIFFATATGQVKKTPLVDFSRPRQTGIIAIDLREDDRLVGAALTDGSRELMLFSDTGKSIRFAEADVRSMGRTAGGVRGIRMDESQRVVSLIVVGEGQVLTATEHGYGKRTPIDDFPLQGRGGQGVIAIQTSERNGALVGAALVQDDDEVILISDAGTLVRTQVSQISSVSRNTQGVILIRLSDDEKLVQLA